MVLIDILKETLRLGGSDIFIVPGSTVKAKVQGRLVELTNERLSSSEAKSLICDTYELAMKRGMDLLMENGDDDFSFSLEKAARLPGGHLQGCDLWSARS